MVKKLQFGHKHKSDKHKHKWRKYKMIHAHKVHHNAKVRKAYTGVFKARMK